jgi:hypothetical protein
MLPVVLADAGTQKIRRNVKRKPLCGTNFLDSRLCGNDGDSPSRAPGRLHGNDGGAAPAAPLCIYYFLADKYNIL